MRHSGVQWHKKLVKKLKSLNFMQIPQDPCLFTVHKNGGKITIVAVYVDDMIIAINDNEWLLDVKRELSHAFEMKDLGEINYCLGIELTRDKENRVYLNQKFSPKSYLNVSAWLIVSQQQHQCR